jgi:hypothetical protein
MKKTETNQLHRNKPFEDGMSRQAQAGRERQALLIAPGAPSTQ